jgi:hypothetical protein
LGLGAGGEFRRDAAISAAPSSATRTPFGLTATMTLSFEPPIEILKGANPAELPIEQPTRLELVVNQKAAKALSLTIPQSILISGDKVIK